MHRLRILLLTVLACAWAALAVGAEDDGWVIAAKARNPQDISLWTRNVPGAPLKAFRGATHTDVALPNVVALLYDASSMCAWVFRCKEARIVGVDQATGDTFVYMAVRGIWPVGDRDAIIRVHPVWNVRTGELSVQGTAAPTYLPKTEGHVRIPAIESSWRFTPAGNNLLRIEWTGHIDPGGNVPLWLANTVATLVPRYTLRQVRDLLQESGWRSNAARDAGLAQLNQVRTQVR